MFTLTLTDEDDSKHTLKADSRDVLVWEKTSRTNERYVQLLSEMSIEKFYRLAWITARRTEYIDNKLSLDDFGKRFRMDIVTEDKVPPTNAEVSNET